MTKSAGNYYKSCVIYKGDCSCGSRYIGKTKHNAEVRWNEHNNLAKSSEPQNTFEATSTTILHGLLFQMLQKKAITRKNLEGSYIALWKPDLNEQKDFERLVIFRNGVTKSN